MVEKHELLIDENNRRVLFLVNHEVVIYNFRLELVERLLAEGYEVHISTPPGERVEKLRELGAVIHDISFDRHGIDPREEFGILRCYGRLMQEVKPLIVFGYTIKPNIYGALAANRCHIPFVANITGLGTVVENGGLKQQLSVLLYKIAFGTKHGKVQRVFFQNEENMSFFREHSIATDKHQLIPGSGVNIDRYPATPLPKCGDGKSGEPIKFLFISRIMVEKGIDYYLSAAESIKAEYPNTEFHVCGFFEPEYDRERFERLVHEKTVSYHGNIDDVAGFISTMHCIVHPTYYPEGLSNVLLEASSCGRPIITTDRPGCREVVDGNGFLIDTKNGTQLTEAIKRFINLPFDDKVNMGESGRKLAEVRFDRSIVVDAYMKEVGIATE